MQLEGSYDHILCCQLPLPSCIFSGVNLYWKDFSCSTHSLEAQLRHPKRVSHLTPVLLLRENYSFKHLNPKAHLIRFSSIFEVSLIHCCYLVSKPPTLATCKTEKEQNTSKIFFLITIQFSPSHFSLLSSINITSYSPNISFLAGSQISCWNYWYKYISIFFSCIRYTLSAPIAFCCAGRQPLHTTENQNTWTARPLKHTSTKVRIFMTTVTWRLKMQYMKELGTKAVEVSRMSTVWYLKMLLLSSYVEPWVHFGTEFITEV